MFFPSRGAWFLKNRKFGAATRRGCPEIEGNPTPFSGGFRSETITIQDNPNRPG
jgi:hypothetical protein